ncbi:MAG: hypothetical protein U0T77_02720 [Chitinophagales bacterium]
MKTIVLVSVFLITCSIQLSAQKKPIVFPTFSLLKMDSTSYLTNADLAENKNTIFINFSPTCEHCQRTINSILVNISKFEETQFYCHPLKTSPPSENFISIIFSTPSAMFSSARS